MRTREIEAMQRRKAITEWRAAMAEWESANTACAKAVRNLEMKFTRRETASKLLEASYLKLKALRRAKPKTDRMNFIIS